MKGIVAVAVRLPTYDEGAFAVTIQVEPRWWQDIPVTPVVFDIPKLTDRAIYSDAGYRIAVPNNKSDVEIKGALHQGKWMGHCYTNGVPESQNKTPVKDVEAALETSVEQALSILRLALSLVVPP